MIQKNKVTAIGLKRVNQRLFSVAGYEKQLGFYPASRKRLFKTYEQACRYAIELQDYYQSPVVEFS